MSLWRNLHHILFRDAEQNAIPSMDGPLAPNDALETCEPIGDPIPGLEDVVQGPDGALYVSAGRRILRLSGVGFTERQVLATLTGEAGGIAYHPDGRLLVCVAHQGLVAIAPSGVQQPLHGMLGHAFHCLTDVYAAPDGNIYFTQGSSAYEPSGWRHDLMQKNRKGSLFVCGPDLDEPRLLLDGLGWPYGLGLGPDGKLWFSESWAHRICRLEGSHAETVIGNIAGYPARFGVARDGGLWLGIFALRTHLIEFVLREDKYRNEMMRTIAEDFWIAPSYSTSGHYHEPMQSGSVKALGIVKPWAPPRSYGLIAHIDVGGEFNKSLHSRVGGKYHGIVGGVETSQGLVIASKGANRLLLYKGGV